MLIGGVLLALLSQLRIVAVALSDSAAKALLCLLMPGYIILYGRRYETGLLKAWFAGVGFVVLGVGLMSVDTPRNVAPVAIPEVTAASTDGTGAQSRTVAPLSPERPKKRLANDECVRKCRALIKNGEVRAEVTQETCEARLCD
jgi:hypothetical protein